MPSVICIQKEKKRIVAVFYPDMQCPFIASLSCPREHESGDGLGPIFHGLECVVSVRAMCSMLVLGFSVSKYV